MTVATNLIMPGHCPYCSNPPYSYMTHHGICPRIQSILYYPSGAIMKVEFNNLGYVLNRIGDVEWQE